MTWETLRRSKRTVLVVLGLIFFVCSIGWGGPFTILAPLVLSLSSLLSFRVFHCSRCGNDSFFSPPCKKCGAEMISTGSLFSGNLKLAAELSEALVCLFFSFRFTCVPILICHFLFGIVLKGQKRDRWMNVTAIAFVVFLCLPADVEFGSFHGPHWGVQRSGPRFVRLVMGMPRIHRLVERHGEFISGGCAVMGNEQHWLFVWEDFGMGEEASAVRVLPRLNTTPDQRSSTR